MLAKRIIPCLDVMDGKTVKGINFKNLREVGDPVELASYYSEQGADELVFLDITATKEKRNIMVDLVKSIAKNINIPFTIGGGISKLDDVRALLDSGADKVSINSAAVRDPKLIDELAQKFGSQCIVAAVDAKYENNQWEVFVSGGSKPTGLNLFNWINELEKRGAGEILFTSMNNDGTKSGFAIEALAQISKTCQLPLIASGGGGTESHFVDVLQEGVADAALAATIFHDNEISVPQLKNYLRKNDIHVR